MVINFFTIANVLFPNNELQIPPASRLIYIFALGITFI
jgi:hypothetical protein